MGATGRVFNIAENTAVLKYILYKRGIHVITVPPTELKKFATGAGNADKDKMIASFDARHGIDIKKMFGAEKAVSPITDVVDAWWLYEYGRSTIEG